MKNEVKISFLTALLFTTPTLAFQQNSLDIGKFSSDIAVLEVGFSDPQTSFKLASVCFLGIGCGDDGAYNKGEDDFTIDTAKQCQNEGFTYTSSNCIQPGYPSVACPYNDTYFAKCVEDKPRACEDLGYVTSCASGMVLDSSQACPYDGSYKKCKCDPCAGYDYTYEQATASGYVTDGSCMSCAVAKYRRKDNPCSGYQVCECGGEAGSASCVSGTVRKYAVCHPCCENRCSLVSCPENHSCDYEACSNKYCDKGCAVGYTDLCTVYGVYGSQTCQQTGYRQQTCSGSSILCAFDTTYRFCL